MQRRTFILQEFIGTAALILQRVRAEDRLMAFVHFMRSIAGRLLRIVTGAIIIYLALTRLEAPWSYVVAAIGVVPILAGVTNFCLLGPLFQADFWGRPKGEAVR